MNDTALTRDRAATFFMPSSSFLISSGDNCGRSILIVSLLNFAVSGNGGMIVGVVHAGDGIGADIEALIPLQDDRDRLLHPLLVDHLAVHLQRAGTAFADAGKVVVRHRADAQAVILEVELDGVLAGRERLRGLPLDPFEVEQVPVEHRLALEKIEAPARKTPAGGGDHALCSALRHGDVRCEV